MGICTPNVASLGDNSFIAFPEAINQRLEISGRHTIERLEVQSAPFLRRRVKAQEPEGLVIGKRNDWFPKVGTDANNHAITIGCLVTHSNEQRTEFFTALTRRTDMTDRPPQRSQDERDCQAEFLRVMFHDSKPCVRHFSSRIESIHGNLHAQCSTNAEE